MHFTKMHGLGNDYLYVYGEPENPEERSRILSDRHFGVGSDGMVWIAPSEIADFQMRIFNADGSEAKMCGNGIRCVGKYVYDKGYTEKTHLTIETLSGIRTLELSVESGRVVRVSVDMGQVAAEPERSLIAGGQPVSGIPVSVGNPHFVCFVEDGETAPLTTLGPLLEKHEAFPGGINGEFGDGLSPTELRRRGWERGSGVTMACGTGACASVGAAVSQGFCPAGVPIQVHLDGGTLEIVLDADGRAVMTGPAATICEGETELC